MHKFYTDTGWIQIEGEIGRNGIESGLRPMKILTPRNTFEARMLRSYDECRRKYLKKYLHLEDEKIDILLRDNYLQKKDILRIMY